MNRKEFSANQIMILFSERIITSNHFGTFSVQEVYFELKQTHLIEKGNVAGNQIKTETIIILFIFQMNNC